MTAPLFAIVGHPNKGKSSIVATLAQDESVAISPLPGTTTDQRIYPMQVDGETLYRLVDTPGFQRARATLEWMQRQAGSSAQRAEIVRRFVAAHRDDPQFAAECRLLAPVLDSAGILYVVDGSRPFGEEYEAEMEILRWTGQPSMALINLIGERDRAGQWERALAQYFRVVRVFDATTADFDRRIQLLLAFGQLREEWHQPLEKAVRILREERSRRRKQSARRLAETIARMLVYSKSYPASDEAPSRQEQEKWQSTYRKKLVDLEQHCRTAVEHIYNHRQIERKEAVFEILDEDLFARETWQLFGLSRQQLISTGTMGGAATGGVIDLAVGGSSLLLGSALGAVIGGASAWVTADRIADVKILGRPVGGKELRVGPMHNLNFPYVALGRALLHHRMIEDRTHAQRDALDLGNQPTAMQELATAQRKPLEKVFSSLRKQGAATPQLVDDLAKKIETLIQTSDRPAIDRSSE